MPAGSGDPARREEALPVGAAWPPEGPGLGLAGVKLDPIDSEQRPVPRPRAALDALGDPPRVPGTAGHPELRAAWSGFLSSTRIPEPCPLPGSEEMQQRGFPGEKTSELGRRRMGAAGGESGLEKRVRAGETPSCAEGELEFGRVGITDGGGLTF